MQNLSSRQELADRFNVGYYTVVSWERKGIIPSDCIVPLQKYKGLVVRHGRGIITYDMDKLNYILEYRKRGINPYDHYMVESVWLNTYNFPRIYDDMLREKRWCHDPDGQHHIMYQDYWYAPMVAQPKIVQDAHNIDEHWFTISELVDTTGLSKQAIYQRNLERKKHPLTNNFVWPPDTVAILKS